MKWPSAHPGGTYIQLISTAGDNELLEAPENIIVLNTRRADLRGRTIRQSLYLPELLPHDITFGIGLQVPGKTTWQWPKRRGCAGTQSVRPHCALLTRPAVGAGERLNRPNDLARKVDTCAVVRRPV